MAVAYQKLTGKKNRPCMMLKKINNTCHIGLHTGVNIFATDTMPYKATNYTIKAESADLRSNSSECGEE